MVKKKFQGPVRPTTDEQVFRETGISVPKFQGPVRPSTDVEVFRRTGQSIQSGGQLSNNQIRALRRQQNNQIQQAKQIAQEQLIRSRVNATRNGQLATAKRNVTIARQRKEIILREVQPAPRKTFIERQEAERLRLRTKKLRGKKLTLKEEGLLVGRTFIQGVSEFGVGVVQLPKTLVNVAKNPKQLKKVPSAISRGGKNFGQLIRVSPTEAFVKLGTEILLLRGSGEVLNVAGKVGSKTATRLSPKFKPLKKGEIKINVKNGNVKAKVGKPKTPKKIKVAGAVKKIREPLRIQVKLSGRSATAVSTQADRLLKILKTKKVIRKPIPNEVNLPKATKRLLSKFDKRKITKRELLALQRRTPLLERSLFADPRGRFRPSRLGLQERRATFIETLAGDVTYRASKPQILVFPNVKVQKFPKSLKKVEQKLRKGKKLTSKEAKQLLDFQLKQSGKFKPIGALTREPEITLAPNEIIKKVKTLGVTLINGRRVSIVQARVIKPSPATIKLLRRAKKGKISRKDSIKLQKKLKKETGFSPKLSRTSRVKPRARIPKLILRGRATARRRRLRAIATARRRVLPIPRRKPIRPVVRKVVRRKVAPRKRALRKTPSRKVTARGLLRPRLPPKTLKGVVVMAKKKKAVKKVKKKPQRSYSVFARPLKKVKGKRPKLIKVSRVPLTKQRAMDLRNYVIDTSLSRTGMIKATRGKPKKLTSKVPRGYGARTQKKFRTFRRVKGVKKSLGKGKVIERRKRLLDTRQEKKGITLRRRVKQIRRKK